MKNQDRELAVDRVKARVGFFVHLAVYILVGALLIVIDVVGSPDQMWAHWPLMGWGIGVAFHGLGALVFRGRSLITEQMIDREMKRQAS